MLETIAVLFSIIYVILAAKKNIWCWVAAAISVALYIYICYNAKLLAETGLQIFYFLMAIVGYYSWKGLKNKDNRFANQIKKKTIDLVKQKGFNEYFSCKTGKGFGATNFSWTASLFLDLILENKYE